MKKIILSIIFATTLFACQHINKTSKKESENIKEKINTILNNWHNDAAEANFKQYFNAMDKTSVFVGTDASENWSKKEFQKFSKPHFDKGEAWKFTTLERNIYISKNAEFVWFDELLKTWMGICRGSGVLEKVSNKWIIKQYVLSITIPNDCTREVVKLKIAKDSILMNNLR